MFTPTEVIAYEQAYGAREAADLMILGGPDWFDGDFWATTLYLEQIDTSERDLERVRGYLEDTEYPMFRTIYSYQIGLHMGRIEHCRQVLRELALGYEDRING